MSTETDLVNLSIVRTKKGHPAKWEQGGNSDGLGDVVLIGDEHGSPKRALYVKRNDKAANGEHVLLPLKVGDIVVNVKSKEKVQSIHVMEIVSIPETEELQCDAKLINIYTDGIWQTEIAEGTDLYNMVISACEKAAVVDCQRGYWYQDPPQSRN